MTIKKLDRMPYANAHIVIADNGTTALVSYQTTVCVIYNVNGSRWLVCNGLYSMTTRKHIGAFMHEFTDFGYQTAKELYNTDYALNLDTLQAIKNCELEKILGE